MKKYVFSFIFVLVGLSCNAQIYKSIKYYDKFDDVIKSEQRKTLVTMTDSTFIVEEKGKDPVVYQIMDTVSEGTKGSKDEIVNLVNDVYGYQEAWLVLRSDMKEGYHEALANCVIDDTKTNREKVASFLLFIVHRTITTQYTGRFLNEYFWIKDELSDGKLGKDINRIIYIYD